MFDSKRKRVNNDDIMMENTRDITIGLSQDNESKNMIGVGPVNQARLIQ